MNLWLGHFRSSKFDACSFLSFSSRVSKIINIRHQFLLHLSFIFHPLFLHPWLWVHIMIQYSIFVFLCYQMQYIAQKKSLEAEEAEIFLVKGQHNLIDNLSSVHPPISVDELQILKGQETLACLRANCTSNRGYMVRINIELHHTICVLTFIICHVV